MPFVLSHVSYLEREVERAKGVLLVHMEDGQEYTQEELIRMLADYGLDYSNPEYVEIGMILLDEGFLEIV